VLARRELGHSAIGPAADDRGETRELVEALMQELAGGHDVMGSGGDDMRREGEAHDLDQERAMQRPRRHY
jgi:hypothetical protein